MEDMQRVNDCFFFLFFFFSDGDDSDWTKLIDKHLTDDPVEEDFEVST